MRTTSGERLRVAVVGAGWVATRVHLPYFGGSPRTQLVGLFDTDRILADSVAAAFGTRAFGSMAELLRHADLVSVCTPGRTHYDIVEAALNADKHVICEKPLTLSGPQAEKLEMLARSRGVNLYCCMTNRHRADVRAMAQQVASGIVGQPRLIDASWLRSNGIPGRPGPVEQGVLWDLGSHLVDIVMWMTNWHRPTDVTAFRTRVAPEGRRSFASWYHADTEQSLPTVSHDTAMLSFTGDHGALARIHVSWSAHLPSDRCGLLVVGDEGALQLRTVFGWSPDRQKYQGAALRVSLGSGPWQDVYAEQDREHREYRHQFDNMLGVVDLDVGWVTDLGPTLMSVRILDQAHESLDRREDWRR